LKVWGKLGTHFGKGCKVSHKIFSRRVSKVLWSVVSSTMDSLQDKRGGKKKGGNLKILFEEMGMVDLGVNERNWHYWV
jgi:hypothetical protein